MFIKKSEIESLRKNAANSKLKKVFKMYVQELAENGIYHVDILAVMRKAEIRNFDQDFVDFLKINGFDCADTADVMDDSDGTISWANATEKFAKEMKDLTDTSIKSDLLKLRHQIEEELSKDPYKAEFEATEKVMTLGVRMYLREQGYEVKKVTKTINGFKVYSIEL